MGKKRKRNTTVPDEESMVQTLKQLALMMSVKCVRNTVIEEYHVAGKINDKEMMAFNMEVSNKVFTVLYYLYLKGPDALIATTNALSVYYPQNWNIPEIDKELEYEIEATLKGENFLFNGLKRRNG